jgi:hypothetical protein
MGIPIAIVAIGVVIAFLATPAKDAVEALLGPPEGPTAVEPVPGAGQNDFVVPALTAGQIARAKGILANDARAAALLRGNRYDIEDMVPVMDSASSSSEPIGVSMMISLGRPISVEGFWLMKHDPAPGDAPGSGPQEVSVHYPDCAAPNGVLKAFATVYFTQGKLVVLEPLGVPGFDVGTKYCQGGPQ